MNGRTTCHTHRAPPSQREREDTLHTQGLYFEDVVEERV